MSPAKGLNDDKGSAASEIQGEGESWDYSAWNREGLGEILSVCINTGQEGLRKMEPGSSGYPVTGQDAIGTKSEKEILFNYKKKPFSKKE